MKNLGIRCEKLRHWGTVVTLSCISLTLGTAAHAAGEEDAAESRLEPQRAVIEATDRATISSEVSGRIEKMEFREGDAFTKGQTLVKMDCSLYAAERDRVGARLASARRQLQNNQRLLELRSVGQLDVDLSRLAVNENDAEYRIARTNMNRCDIKSPYDGRVVERKASVGQSVEAQAELLSIVGQALEARIIVPADWLAWLEPGRQAQLTIEETRENVSAKVTRVGASVDPVSHTIPIWAEIKVTPALRPGMTASAIFTPPLDLSQGQ
ncbi:MULTISPECIES: efflux RND transporter periplasmic adaptor subunit [Cobetia]|uniref:Efflux RND transporter periplasmic adaptor subunit n=1 Tax=Cobetia crustatorum TaxID=553385 RepID=A0A558HKH0_9GAMM|nr:MULTISPECIES: efflux RND transporter periplasmic adaptor subunit [Cobetia]TVU69558.1 efflux RND transporter periplasmic adaptor subunit [Cobetia crustatorum]